jgi:hypothetical protein
MIFEDAHCADPTSLELFGRIVDKIPALRVLLIVTFRPEFEQHDLAFAGLGLRPAPKEKFDFFLPANKLGQSARVQRLEAAFDRSRSMGKAEADLNSALDRLIVTGR